MVWRIIKRFFLSSLVRFTGGATQQEEQL